MESLTINHWIGTPVRNQPFFEGVKPRDCVEDHSLFALPGPAFPALGECDGTALRRQRQGADLGFQVLLDVAQFRPEDILIQVFEGWLLVKCQHGRKMDEHGFVSRCFTRQYRLPEHLRAEDLRAMLCHDGILVVETKSCAPSSP
nr:heat shock protein beta-3 [Paramormyrops kingsleyae]